MPLLSFHNDRKIKAKYLKRVRDHAKADEIIKGKYWENGKGCCVGCLIHGSDHSVFPTKDGPGWPEWLARLADTLFEKLPNGHSKSFPCRLTEAIPVGKDLEPVKWRFCSFILGENIERVKTLNIADGLKKKVIEAIEQCKKCHDDAIENGSAWSAARSAARSVASAAESAARSAAWSAAESAASAASAASAESAAESAYIRYADKLLELLKAA